MSHLGVVYKPGDIVSASYTFKKDKHEDLSFNRNEQLRILNIAKDPNWAHAKNANGETGLIPLNYVKLSGTSSVDLTCYQWFHGRISRAESEKVLAGHPPGSFMIRNSDLFTGDLTLCVVGPPQSLDAHLNAMNGGSNYQVSISVDDLPPTNVQHYHIICKHVNDVAPATSRARDITEVTTHYSLDEYDWFTNLQDLIEYYAIPDSGLVAPLKYPVADLLRERLKRLRESGWLISRKELVLGDQIGRGEFGEVLRATYKHTDVAVKICKKTACKLAVTYEAALMTNLRHPNLVSFVGLVYEPEDNAIYLVTEYHAQGNLLTYLHSRTRDEVTEKDKLQFSIDACRGLSYLEERGIIHRDIAARNILLSGRPPRIVAKLADFGMARDLTHATPYPTGHYATGATSPMITSPASNYGRDPLDHVSPFSERHCAYSSESESLDTMHSLSLHDNAAIPIKWSAPEAVRKRQFTIKSDVWSFGILLWEIYSYGRIPYPRMLASQVLPQLKAGYRMKAPEGCPSEIYRLMRQTWNIDPEERPSFATILTELTALLTAHPVSTVERVLNLRSPSVGRTPVSMSSSGTYVVTLAPRAEIDDDPWFSRSERRRSLSNGHGGLRTDNSDDFTESYRVLTTPRLSRAYQTLTQNEGKRMSRSFTLTKANIDDRSNGANGTAVLIENGGHSIKLLQSR
ncbi:Tyrosine-protein kinase csk [Clonorchis sinensis]|uniref:Tyrosine-protein kinase n=2 Tax=Clonorchis sinensis TaxID=79923 RepID=G7YWV7_CLOSI|nr:Tyrosine-protein kinase csk [Clonorchis sinensis]GAA57437.1 tyrosine-protein kinase CSK [Clonorchis sinensis]